MQDDFENIEVTEIHVGAKSGSRIDLCMKEAVHLAVQEGHDVVLTHNASTFRVKYEDLQKCVKKV